MIDEEVDGQADGCDDDHEQQPDVHARQVTLVLVAVADDGGLGRHDSLGKNKKRKRRTKKEKEGQKKKEKIRKKRRHTYICSCQFRLPCH